MIEVRCPHCGLRILVPPTVRGRTGICFACGQKITIPLEPQAVEPTTVTFRNGERISDRYTIRELIGYGGMGVVYRAFDTLVREEVALKFMKPKSLRTERGRRFFVQEALVARRLRHENVVAVHDVGITAEGILYISMELLDGQSLRTLLNRARKHRTLLDVRLAVTIIDQVLAALEYAHRMVMHRDIKPENIMILANERAKVLDFGLAKAVEAEQTSIADPAQKPKGVIGTLAYAAPEQVRKLDTDLRADLFATGLIFRELITLRTPMDEPIEIPDLRKDVSPSLLAVLAKALERDRDRRWQSAREFRTHLAEAFTRSYRPVLLEKQSAPNTPHRTSTQGMIYLEGGHFLMGNNEFPDESPQFETHVDPFYIDQTPVTVAQYAEYLKDTGAPPPKFWRHAEYSGPQQPVVGVSWHEANAYAAWAGKQLPTEAQWEFAARGRENRLYPWGRLEPDPIRCNFRDYLGMPSIVTMHEEGMTPTGLKDMAGNVFEWILDPFAHYAASPQQTAGIPMRVVRGGSWHSTAREIRCTYRTGLFPEAQLNTVGFRCVLPARSEWTPAEQES